MISKTPNISLLEPPVPDVTVISLTSPASNAFQEWNKDVEETNKWHTTDGHPSPQVPSPADATEEAEEALGLVLELPVPPLAPDPPHPETTITSLHSLTTKVTIARKASQTWKGFSLKKQLNRVKKNPLLPNRDKTPSACLSNNVSPNDEFTEHRKETDLPEDEWTIVESSSHNANSEKCAENILRTSDDTGGGDSAEDGKGIESKFARLNRPADLPLFESDGRPVRPPRLHQSGQKKKSGSERDKRDTRLLSVPNVKHQKQDQLSLRDLRRKQQSTGTQPSFGNLLIRHFSKWRLSHRRPPERSTVGLERSGVIFCSLCFLPKMIILARYSTIEVLASFS